MNIPRQVSRWNHQPVWRRRRFSGLPWGTHRYKSPRRRLASFAFFALEAARPSRFYAERRPSYFVTTSSSARRLLDLKVAASKDFSRRV